MITLHDNKIDSPPTTYTALQDATYQWGPGIDNLISFTCHRSGKTHYAIKDHLNTITAFIDRDEAITESYQYDAFGNVTIIPPRGFPIPQSAIGNRYMF